MRHITWTLLLCVIWGIAVVIAALLGSCINAQATPSINSNGSGVAAKPATTLSWTNTTATGVMYMCVGIGKWASSATTISSVAWRGQTLSLLGSVTQGNYIEALYGLMAPAVGAGNVTVTVSAASDIVGQSEAYNNVFAVWTPITGTNQGRGVTLSVTTHYNDSWIFGVFGHIIAQATITAPTPEVTRIISAAAGLTLTGAILDKPFLTPGTSNLIAWFNNTTMSAGVAVELWGQSPTGTYTRTPVNTFTFTITPTPTFTITKTITQTITPTFTVTQTITPTVTPSITPTYTITVSPTYTITNTGTFTITATPTFTITNTPTYTVTSTISQSPTFTITVSPTFSVTPTISQSPTFTITNTSTYTVTQTISESPTFTITATPTFTNTPSPTHTITISPTYTDTITDTPTYTVTPTITMTATFTVTPTITLTVTRVFALPTEAIKLSADDVFYVLQTSAQYGGEVKYPDINVLNVLLSLQLGTWFEYPENAVAIWHVRVPQAFVYSFLPIATAVATIIPQGQGMMMLQDFPLPTATRGKQ